jgi:peroxiredoxin
MHKKNFQQKLFTATLTLLVLLLASCGKNRFHIEGTITDAKDSILYLEHMSLDGPIALDSVKLNEKGDFSFSGERAEAPEFYRLRIAQGIINVSIDSTETVTIKASYPTMSTQYEVKGSENCNKIKELAVMQQQLLAQALAINSDATLGAKQTEDSINGIVERYKDYVRMNYIFKEPQKAYSYYALFQTLGNRLIFNPRESEMDIRSFAAVATAWDTYYPEAERGANLHNIAIEGLKVLRHNQAKQYAPVVDASKIEEVTILDVPLVDNKGRKRSLKELKGQVVLLDFHVFSAPKSTERIMMLRELYNKYHSRGLEVYQVGLDSDEHFWKTQTAALPWINVYDPDGGDSKYLRLYNVMEIPTFFLIDRSNTLYKRDAQIKDLTKEIEGLL